jgi:hypothetical protein
MGYAHSHFLSSDTRSLITITQLTVDQAKARRIMINLTATGKTPDKIDTKSPKNDKGIKQYPITLKD